MRISDWSSDVCSSDLLGRTSRCSPPPSDILTGLGAGLLVRIFASVRGISAGIGLSTPATIPAISLACHGCHWTISDSNPLLLWASVRISGLPWTWLDVDVDYRSSGSCGFPAVRAGQLARHEQHDDGEAARQIGRAHV